MIKRIFFLVFLVPLFIHSQYSIQGKIEQGDNFSWVLLYKIKNGKQIYIANADVKNNNFEFTIPESEEPGIFRIFYHVENQLHIEFIYNKEHINLVFNPNEPVKSLQFIDSDENVLYQDYLKKINSNQQELDSLQIAFFNSKETKHNKKIKKSYLNKLDQIKSTQLDFENLSHGRFVNSFIKAGKNYNAENPIKLPSDYLIEIKKHFFDAIDFNDSILINSTLINDKILDYIFYLNQSNDVNELLIMQMEAIETSLNHIESSFAFKKNMEELIINQFVDDQNSKMVNYMLESHYNNLPVSYQDHAFKKHVLSEVKTAIGLKAPDIQWTKNGYGESLYELAESKVYIVVFFSSDCPHCQEEIPKFYELVSTVSNLTVITIGLEDEKSGWDHMVKDLPQFINILDLNKWDSDRVEAYGINSIPNYFILNQEKIILAKPEDLEELKGYFE